MGDVLLFWELEEEVNTRERFDFYHLKFPAMSCTIEFRHEESQGFIGNFLTQCRFGGQHHDSFLTKASWDIFELHRHVGLLTAIWRKQDKSLCSSRCNPVTTAFWQLSDKTRPRMYVLLDARTSWQPSDSNLTKPDQEHMFFQIQDHYSLQTAM